MQDHKSLYVFLTLYVQQSQRATLVNRQSQATLTGYTISSAYSAENHSNIAVLKRKQH